MYIHTFACFCESRRRFSLFSPLNIYISLFFVLSLLPACCRVFSSFPSSSTLQARGHPRPSLLPSSAPPACRVFRGCRAVCPLSVGRALEALRRPAVLSPLSGCPLVAAVTRPLSGAKRYDSGGRCSAYISPALSPPAYVLPCVPLVVPWLPCGCLCVCPAVCRLVVTIAYTPLCPGRLRCGAASVM